MGLSGCNGVVAFACIISTVRGDTTDVVIWLYLAKQVGQHGRIANTTACDLNGPYLQRFLINSYMKLAP